jgi:hypothetical protein
LNPLIQVQESRLAEALSLLGEAGFDLYSDAPELDGVQDGQQSSPPLSPIADSEDRPPHAVLTRTRSSTNTSIGSTMSDVNSQAIQPLTSRSRSPAGKVELLPSSLACVGLSETDKSMWMIKLMKLIAFSDLIPTSYTSTASDQRQPPTPPPEKSPSATEGEPELEFSSCKPSARPFFSFTTSPDGSSLTTDVAELAVLFPPTERHLVKNGGELDAEDLKRSGLEREEDLEDDATLKCLQIDLQKFGLGKFLTFTQIRSDWQPYQTNMGL